RLPAVAAVTRKSNGEVKNRRKLGDAYATAEKTAASDQSAGEATRRSNRPRITTAAMKTVAVTYDLGVRAALRQSSSGPASSSQVAAKVIRASDSVACRHSWRAYARSARDTTAVSRRAPDGAFTSKA